MRNRLLRLLGKGFLGVFLLGGFVSEIDGAFGPPPVIAVQPLGISVLEGGDALFAVVPVSITPMTFQWWHDGKKIGGNSSVLVVHSVKSKDSGDYRVEITNGGGSVMSSAVTLLVLTKPLEPVLNLLPSRMTTNGFNLQLSGPAGSNYVILASSDMVNWTPIATNSAPTGTVNFTDTNAVNLNFRYYKAEIR
ncbi:MAG TPA: immunoglobulin domain-containing protein [Verrucomicrobiae bacterium]